MKALLAGFVIAMSLASPPLAAQVFSWDPLKDVQEVLPEGTPNEGKVIQGRIQVGERLRGFVHAVDLRQESV